MFDVVCQFRAYTPAQMKKDIATFTGKTGQYVFISSASAYQKPARHYVITEKTPLENPYWQYSRDKIACETMLREQSALPWTIVRPSHTVRTGLPLAIGDGDAVARRLLRGAPVIVHGDGTFAVDADPLGRSRGAVRQAVRQRQPRSARTSTSPPTAPSPGTRSPTPSPPGSAWRRRSSMCRPIRWCATTRHGKGRSSATRAGRRCSTTAR